MELTKEEIKKAIGGNIRKLRIEKKMSIETMAFNAAMDYTQLSRIELGKINTSIYQLYKIAKTLQVSIEELVNIAS
ncbi:MAG: Helix-turn-helix domain [Bacteroidota bacterium]|jgi:transcriptional regulator with XRE-family HTH domain